MAVRIPQIQPKMKRSAKDDKGKWPQYAGQPSPQKLLRAPCTKKDSQETALSIWVLSFAEHPKLLIVNQMVYLFQDDYITLYTKTDVERDTCVISWFIFTYYIHICVWFVCRSTYILYINMTSAGGMTLRMCFVGMDQWSSCRNQNKRGLLAELEVSWNGGVPQNGWFNGKSH